MPASKDVLTVSDIATMFAVDTKTVTRWAKAGLFPAGAVFVTPGGHRRYRREPVEAMMQALTVRPAG